MPPTQELLPLRDLTGNARPPHVQVAQPPASEGANLSGVYWTSSRDPEALW